VLFADPAYYQGVVSKQLLLSHSTLHLPGMNLSCTCVILHQVMMQAMLLSHT